MPKTRLPVGVFAPDSEVADSPILRDAENVLPVYGSYRLIPRITRVSEAIGKVDTAPISGGHVHLVTLDRSLQYARPIKDFPTSPPFHWADEQDRSPYYFPDGSIDIDETLGIYQSVDEPIPDDTDYIKTIRDDFGYQSFYLSAVQDPTIHTGHVLRFRWKSTGTGTVLYSLGDWNSGSPIAIDNNSLVIASADDEWTIEEYTIASGSPGATDIVNYDELYVSIVSTAGFTVSPTIFDPDETIGNSGGWVGEDSSTDIHAHVGDIANDAEYMVTPTMPAGGFNFWCALGLPDQLQDTGGDFNHKVRIRAKYVTTDAATLKVRLKQDQTTIATKIFTLTGSWATQEFEFDDADIANITDYNQLQLVIQAENTGSTAGTVQVSAIEWELPQAGQFWISQLELEVPSANSGAEVSKDADLNYQYIGTKDKLYEVDPKFVWSDVTRYTTTPGDDDYSQGNDLPHSWGFASWGQDVIATNYVDELQIKTLTTNYANLITSPASDEYEVRSRHVAVINNFLVCADIHNHAASGAGGSGTIGDDIGNPYTIWWSAINDNTSFKIVDLATQSDYQPLVDRPGAITGLVGGDYGLVFKRNAIYRMEYVGNDLFFTFDHVSVSDGTSFPRGIVKAGRDVYFIGAGNIQVVRDGQYVEDLGDGQITRWFFDSQFNAEALLQWTDVDSRNVDSQVIGDYNPVTRCITWLYTPAAAHAFNRGRRMLVYNIPEGRFTKYDIDSDLPGVDPFYFTHYMSLKNSITSGGPITRLDQYYAYDPANGTQALFQLTGERHSAARLTSGVISSQAITGSDQPMNVLIKRIRPIFHLEGSGYPFPPMTLMVTSSNDPELRASSFTQALYGDRDDDGWFPLPEIQSGEFFQFDLSIAETPSQLKYFAYWQVDWEPLGEF